VFGLLADVILQLAERPGPCVLPVASTAALARAPALTEEQADGAPRLAAIAKAAARLPRTLARRFLDELGLTRQQALRRIRIIRAVELLATTQVPVTQIALAVGYCSASAFNAAFRDLIGTSPTAYRNSFKGFDTGAR